MSFNFIKLENRKYELTPSTSEHAGSSFSAWRCRMEEEEEEDDDDDDAGAGNSISGAKEEEEAGGSDAEGGCTPAAAEVEETEEEELEGEEEEAAAESVQGWRDAAGSDHLRTGAGTHRGATEGRGCSGGSCDGRSRRCSGLLGIIKSAVRTGRALHVERLTRARMHARTLSDLGARSCVDAAWVL